VTLTLNRVILHTVVHHLSTSAYMPNFIEIEETFCGRTDVRTFETGFTRSTLKSQRKNLVKIMCVVREICSQLDRQTHTNTHTDVFVT